MLTQVSLVNFKGHSDTRIELGKITALVGRNGVGKTSVLQALHYISQLATKSCQDVFRDEREPQYLVKKNAQSGSIDVAGMWGHDNWSAQVKFKKNTVWKPFLSWKQGEQKNAIDGWKGSFSSAGDNLNLKKALRYAVYLKIAAEKLSEPSYVKQAIPRIEYNGYGLPTAVAYLMTAEPERFRKLEDAVQSVIPFVTKIRVSPSLIRRTEQRLIKVNDVNVPFDEKKEDMGHELFLDFKNAESVPAHAVSEGTLLILGLLTILVSPTCPNLILLDDIEQGLHPRAQRDIVKIISDLIAERDYSQIVLTTHSPYVVDELTAKDVWLLNADDANEIFSHRLSSHPDAEQALQMLSTGELWSAVGEDWVRAK